MHFVGRKYQTIYPKCWTKLHFVGLKIDFVGLKENPLKMSEFLRNKCFVKGK
jgi:hypothetical protein